MFEHLEARVSNERGSDRWFSPKHESVYKCLPGHKMERYIYLAGKKSKERRGSFRLVVSLVLHIIELFGNESPSIRPTYMVAFIHTLLFSVSPRLLGNEHTSSPRYKLCDTNLRIPSKIQVVERSGPVFYSMLSSVPVLAPTDWPPSSAISSARISRVSLGTVLS